MILMSSRTSWWWSRTSMTDVADARDADVFIATIMSPREPLMWIYYNKNELHIKPEFIVKVSDRRRRVCSRHHVPREHLKMNPNS